jgi:hypothetical protein
MPGPSCLIWENGSHCNCQDMAAHAGCVKANQPAGEASLRSACSSQARGRLPRRGELGLLHASPPCQGLTPLNSCRNVEDLQTKLFPLLRQASLLCC